MNIMNILVTGFTSFFRRISFKQGLGNFSDITGLLPIIGYGMVIMSFIDFIYVIFPLRLQNPEWEINTISTFTQHCWAFLIGLGFIFSRYFGENQDDVRFVEIVWLRFIRWVILIMGIVLLLTIPLIMLDTQRLLTLVNNKITEQQNTNLEQISQIEKLLASEASAEKIKVLGKNINMSPEELNLPAPQIKETIKQNLIVAKQKIPQEAKQAQQQEKISRWKNSVRIIISLIIIGVTFILVWLKTGQTTI